MTNCCWTSAATWSAVGRWPLVGFATKIHLSPVGLQGIAAAAADDDDDDDDDDDESCERQSWLDRSQRMRILTFENFSERTINLMSSRHAYISLTFHIQSALIPLQCYKK